MNAAILVPIFVSLGLFSLIGSSVYFISKFKHETKKAIIEKGGSIEFPKRKMRFLEVAFTLIGFGLGLALAGVLLETSLREETKGMLTGALIFLCSGSGLFTAILMRRNIEKKEQ